jgi:hypothetical protein
MANHRIPNKAFMIERHHGIDVNGNVITFLVYQHTRKDHPFPMFFTVQYRELNRRIDRPSRYARQYSGLHAYYRMDTEWQETRELLAASREQAAKRIAAGD